ALGSVFALGAAMLAFFAALRRESPEAPAKPAGPSTVTPPPPPMPHVPAPLPAAPMAFAADVPPVAELTAPPIAPATGGATAIASSVDLRVFPRSTFLERLAAFALDVTLVWLLFEYFLGGRTHDERFVLELVAYYIGFWTWKGTTVGGIICNL